MCCQFIGFVYGIFSYLKMFTQLNMSVLLFFVKKDIKILLGFFYFSLFTC